VKIRFAILAGVAGLTLAGTDAALAAPPQLGPPPAGASFAAGAPITFTARTTSNASTARMDFFISRNPSQVDAGGVFSPFVDHIAGVPTATPGAFVASTDSDDAWPAQPGTYWWQAVQVCAGGDADCVRASPGRMFTISPLPAPLASLASAAPEPDTILRRRPKRRTRKRKVKFAFSSNLPGAQFQCLFAKGWDSCRSPHAFRRLKPGRYKFAVLAIVNGVGDPTPASWIFKVLRRRR
jgi:hypothetical protein